MRRFGRKFIDAKDHDMIVELESRGYQILYPAHECVDRPHLPCPACEAVENTHDGTVLSSIPGGLTL